MKKPFWKRKILQLGRKFGFHLVDSNIPAELFPSILRLRHPLPTPSATLESAFLTKTVSDLSESKGQLCQDLLVLLLLKNKKNGFFVEFGATDGITLSNTFLLEKKYGWEGILAEPASNWQENLRANRHCIIDSRCVWEKSGEKLSFFEANDGELSTISIFKELDGHSEARKKGNEYFVDTISLNDLLAAHNAPNQIDYLSVDTEGSEFAILNELDFSRYSFNVITVEHNFTETREKVFALLTNNGYKRILNDFSQWDDWYVPSNHLFKN
jgi:FkbM family methyltransferase